MSLRNHTSIIRIILFAIGILVVSTLIFSISSKVNSSQNITETILLDTLIVKKKEIPGYPDSVIQKIGVKIDSLFIAANKRYDFHGSILVSKNGRKIFSNEYGYADFAKKTLIDRHSAFQLASVSKQFTAVAVLMLYEENLINLDDTITKYFPELPYPRITIRQLLNHTSGLPIYFWLAEHKWKEEMPPTNENMIALMAEQDLSLFFRPGAMFDYSNTGYLILAALVERVSGESFASFVKRYIFKPLEMDDSFIYSFEYDTIRSHQLAGYRIYRRRYHIEIPGTVNDAVVGDKNVYSTADDLLKWINGLNSYKLIQKQTLDMMYTKGETRYSRKVPYGFGFRIDDRKEELLIYHDGKWNGFRTSIRQYPENDVVIFFLEHSSYSSPTGIIRQVYSIVDNNKLGPTENLVSVK
ncbi:MAG: serine hydrolase domain-containing protein [Bacteroidales bacterium]|nr:serine hydrolase domain-containing protein [Bacteroidales bacterium]